MDVNGAKALQRRLGPNGTVAGGPASDDVPEDAPPVFHWFGVEPPAKGTSPRAADDATAARRSSWLRRLGLSFR